MIPASLLISRACSSVTYVPSGPVDGSAIFNAMGAPGVQYLSGYGFHHSVLLTGIPIGGGSWFYRCGDGTADNTSGAVAFKSAPGPSEDVKISIFGDWGYLDSAQRPMDIPVGGLAKNWSGTLSRELLEGLTAAGEGEVSAVWIVGDQSYADDSFGHTGETLHFGYEECYDGWMEWQFNYSSVMPLMVTAGNHESECHSPYCVTHISTGRALENFTAYNARFAMPSPESGGALNMWYSYDWGPVHVTVINTETDFRCAVQDLMNIPGGALGCERRSSSSQDPASRPLSSAAQARSTRGTATFRTLRLAVRSMSGVWPTAPRCRSPRFPAHAAAPPRSPPPPGARTLAPTPPAPTPPARGFRRVRGRRGVPVVGGGGPPGCGGEPRRGVGGRGGASAHGGPPRGAPESAPGPLQGARRGLLLCRPRAHLQPRGQRLLGRRQHRAYHGRGRRQRRDPVPRGRAWCRARADRRRATGAASARRRGALLTTFCPRAPLAPFPPQQFAPTLEGLREFGKTPHEACTEWCTSGPIQEVNRGKRDPCRHCGEAPGYEAGEAPSGFTSAFATDKLSIGVLAASEIELTWQLLRAPDGLVLDSVTVTK